MSAEEFLFSTLTAAGGVTALVGSGADARIYPGEAKEAAALPLIVFELQDTEYEYTIGGIEATHAETVSVTCWAKTRLGAAALGDAVKAAMEAQIEPPIGRDSVYDEAAEAYASVLMFEMWNR